MSNTNDLATRLQNLRKQNNLSQADVADYLNISRQAISKWENGKGIPDLDNLLLLAKLYNISIDELIYGKSSTCSTTETTPDKVQTANNSILEMIGLSVVLILSVYLPFCGIPVSIFVFVWLKRTKRNYNVVYLLCFLCILLSLYDLLSIYAHLHSNYGTSVIETIK